MMLAHPADHRFANATLKHSTSIQRAGIVDWFATEGVDLLWTAILPDDLRLDR